MKRKGKFNATKVVIDDIKFDSRGESQRYLVLKDRVERGFITALTVHRSYQITVEGMKVCRYIADFVYERDGQTIVEDFKSPASITPVFKLKAKLLKATQGIDIKIVMQPEAE